MRTIVFIVHTEYHLIEAISYILNYYNTSGDKVYIYRISASDRHRLDKFNLNTECLPAEYRVIRFDYNYHFSKDLKDKLEEIVRLKPNYLVFNDEGQLYIPYLARKVKKQGGTICLAPDGINVYGGDKLSLNYRIKYIYHALCFNYSHFLLPPFVPRIGIHHYGYTKYIDELWVENPDVFDNFYNRVVKQKLVFNTSEIRKTINQVFGFNNNLLRAKGKAILYIDGPYPEEVEESMFEIIRKLRDNNPQTPLFIKLHPHSKESAIEKYKTLPNSQFLSTAFPAELYIQNMEAGMIIAAYSTSMLTHNPACTYVWTFPMMDFFGETKKMGGMRNPTSYIFEASNYSEIENLLRHKEK